MIVPLSSTVEEGELVSAMASAAAATNGSNSDLPKVKLLRSASLASWIPK